MKQFIKFSIIGVSNTLISYGIYMFCLLIFQKWNLLPEIDYFVGSVIAFLLSVLWSFYWNDRLTFENKTGERRVKWKVLIKTYLSYSVTGLILNNIFLYLWVDMMDISKNIAPIINLMITVPLNFILNKFWVFHS